MGVFLERPLCKKSVDLFYCELSFIMLYMLYFIMLYLGRVSLLEVIFVCGSNV